MSPRRSRAPGLDGGLLAEPPLAEATRLLAANSSSLATWDADIQGLPARVLRDEARLAALQVAGLSASEARLGVPWIVTGHQPELFHPGVWVKNFAVGAIARDVAGFGLHLVVDNDLPKSAAIRVPSQASDGRLRLLSVPFDSAATEVPYEDWTIADPPLFRSFCGRVLRTLDGLVDSPLIQNFWPRVLAEGPGPIAPGRRFAQARAELERDWGLDLPQTPLGALCETPAFLRFACHLLADAEQFRSIHNDALAEHRRVNHIRSRNHPVPDLVETDGWIETPFWTWTRTDTRRRPLLIQRSGGSLSLRPAGRPPIARDLPLEPGGDARRAIDQLLPLLARGVRIRTRALTTTMFARLFLGDLFVHGIGGAKYDELGDVLIAQFLGITPPAFLVLSQTVWLGLSDFPGAEQELRKSLRIFRDLRYNPERHLSLGINPEFDSWREKKNAAISAPQLTHAQRASRCQAIRSCNHAMTDSITSTLVQVQEQIASLRTQAAWNAAAHHRDLAFVLHPGDRLRAAFARIGDWRRPSKSQVNP